MATAVANGYGQVTAAEQDRADRILSQQETAVTITAVGEDNLTVKNTGAEELRVSDTTVLVNGTTQSIEATTVAGDPTTDLWLPGDELTLEFADPGVATGDRVKIVTQNGVATSTEK